MTGSTYHPNCFAGCLRRVREIAFEPLVIDQADGNLQIISGNQEYGMRANWKLLVKSSIDGYHAASTHDTYFKYLVFTGYRLERRGQLRDQGSRQRTGGAGAPGARPIAKWEPPFGPAAKEIETLRRRLAAEHGAEWARRICDFNRNMLIYPNLIINDIMAVTCARLCRHRPRP